MGLSQKVLLTLCIREPPKRVCLQTGEMQHNAALSHIISLHVLFSTKMFKLPF